MTLEQQVERPQLHITPKRDMLAKYGITLPEFAEFVNVALSGRVVSNVYEGGKVFDLTVKVDDRDRSRADMIRELPIDANGVKVPYRTSARRAGDVAECYADATKSKELLGWHAEKTLEDMCRDTWRWQSQNPNGYED